MAFWIGFIALICLLLALDLGVFSKNSSVVTTKSALTWTSVWVALSLLFTVFVYFAYENHWNGIGLGGNGEPLTGGQAALKYLTGYVIEQSLSMDNIFVIAVIFGYFKVPQQYQHRILFWGILGAIVFRAFMILAGVILIERFSWMIYVFGAILLYSAWKMWSSTDTDIDPEHNPVVNFFKKFMPVSTKLDGEKFFTKLNGATAATPLFICLLVIETTDVLFAFDSIPAIFSITTDPFLVFTSNIFAIMGLRSLYFVLAAMIDKFHHLSTALVFILAFVGLKMIGAHYVHLPEWVSLTVVLGLIVGGIVASLYLPVDKNAPHHETIEEKTEELLREEE